MHNLAICHDTSLYPDFVWVDIDATTCQTLRGFYEAVAEGLVFPEEFGYNLDALDDFLNDLSWIEEDKIILYIHNSEHFLTKERNRSKVITLLDLLDATCEDWKWQDDASDMPTKQLRVLFSPSEHVATLLAELYD